jgi:hypothetical protein
MGKRERAVALAALGAVLLPAAAADARPLALGLADDLAFADSRPGPRNLAFRAARDAGARVARLTLDWAAVAPDGPAKPAGFDAGDPASPFYNWGYIEDAVRDATRNHLRVLLTVVRAPRWAEGARRPASARPGTWRPDPDELAAFLRAAARRFSGFYPDPKQPGDGLTTPGGSLPAVRWWQIWDEPNRPSALRPSGAAHYRLLLNAGAEALRAVSDENVVVAGGTAPRGAFGFWQNLLCLRGSCPARARFDAAAHHPTRGNGPIAARPLAQLAAQLRTARVRRTVTGRRSKPIWLTDLAWATPPLARRGVTLERQALNLRVSLRRAARLPDIQLVVWEGLQDQVTYLPGRFPTIASGLYGPSDRGIGAARPKPALRVFRSGVQSSAAWRGDLQR